MKTEKEKVILVDKENNKIGVMWKLEAHQKGLLHRAFSIFLFNERGELLLQQRAKEKYHCWELWTNTVCSHQRDWESTIDAARRRIIEEMWFWCNSLEIIDHIIYKKSFDNGLTEHEYDYVLIWKYSGEEIKPNPDEVMDYKWISLKDLNNEIKNFPDKYTVWMKIIMEKGIFNK